LSGLRDRPLPISNLPGPARAQNDRHHSPSPRPCKHRPPLSRSSWILRPSLCLSATIPRAWIWLAGGFGTWRFIIHHSSFHLLHSLRGGFTVACGWLSLLELPNGCIIDA
jgi:hypothetical protein